MFELQNHFILGYLSRWLTEITIPLLKAVSTNHQHDDIPEHLMISPGGPKAEREQMLAQQAKDGGLPVYDSETGDVVYPDGRRDKR